MALGAGSGKIRLMNCPRCRADFPAPVPPPSVKHAVGLLLREPQFWVVAVLLMLVAGVLASMLGRFGIGGAGGGAACGFYVALRLRSLRVCPACGARAASTPETPA